MSQSSDHFFKKGEDLSSDFVPQTGEESLINKPWLGRRGDYRDEAPSAPSVAKVKIRNQNFYVRMDMSPVASTTSDESSIDTQTGPGRKAPCKKKCNCCRRKSVPKEPARTIARKKAEARRLSLPKRFRRRESMSMAAIEAEKIGRQLAMAASMFAAGFALGSMGSKMTDKRDKDDVETDDDEDEEEEEEE